MDKRPIARDFSIIDIPTQSQIEREKLIHRIAITTAIILLGIVFVISAIVTFKTLMLTQNLPDVKSLNIHKPDQTTLIYDVNNKLIANIHGDEDRVIVPLNKISPYLQRAVISIEDSRFYSHKGIDIKGTLRAGVTNFSSGGSVQGGSTLTQQLVKNSFLSPERSFKRKIIEAILTLKVERNFSKDQILEMYLNRIYWGNLAYGAEKAAKRYFKKPASQLNLAEASLLAGLIKAPEGYSPYTNLKQAKIRQKYVLERMEYYGYITSKQRIEAAKEPLKFASQRQQNSKYPYFIAHVIYLLTQTYGEDIVRRGGFRVYTTLDPQVQQIAERVITDGVKATKGSGVTQGALVSINVDNGYVQALVGGVDFNKSSFNRAVFSKRAAGSSFKPVVYLTGLRLGKIAPESPIVDAPITLRTKWNSWSPHNWDGRYMGKMTVRKALSLSRNTPTVRVATKVGLNSIIETARLLGIKSPITRNFSIVLGSTGVSPLEMTTVYSTLAREGVYTEPVVIRKIEDSEHNILQENYANSVRVVSPAFVQNLNSILIDVVEKGTGKLAKLPDRTVAGKTGTTDDVKDIWFSGFTPDTATVIWLGNDENKELHGVFSSNCAQIWGMFSKEYYKIKRISPRNFSKPPAIKAFDDKKEDKKKKDDKKKALSGLNIHSVKNNKKINKNKLKKVSKKPAITELNKIKSEDNKKEYNQPEYNPYNTYTSAPIQQTPAPAQNLHDNNSYPELKPEHNENYPVVE